MPCMLLVLLSDNSTKVTNGILSFFLYEYAYFDTVPLSLKYHWGCVGDGIPFSFVDHNFTSL